MFGVDRYCAQFLKISMSKFVRIIRLAGQGLNYDFCPQWNRYFYWLKKPLGWLVCAILFSGLVGLVIGPQGYILMWSLLAFLVAGVIWPWLGMKGISCRLQFDGLRSEEVRPTTARLIVTNRWPIPVFGLMVEGQFLQEVIEEDDKVALGLSRISGWNESEFIWEFKPERRGILPQEPPVITTGFPFGLYKTQSSIHLNHQMIVWPHREPLSNVDELDGMNFNIEGGVCDRPGHDGDVIGARPFRRGDSIRNVNWSKTASAQKLVVMERQTAAQKSIRIVVDLSPDHHGGVGNQDGFEWAIRIAATIINHLHRHQSRIHLTCTGLPAHVDNESSNFRGLNPILDFLAKLPTLAQLRDSAFGFDGVACSKKSGEQSCSKYAKSSFRRDEEVFWIGTRKARQSMPASGYCSHVNEILISDRRGESQPPLTFNGSSNTGHSLPFPTGNSIDPFDYMRNGLERLGSDA